MRHELQAGDAVRLDAARVGHERFDSWGDAVIIEPRGTSWVVMHANGKRAIWRPELLILLDPARAHDVHASAVLASAGRMSAKHGQSLRKLAELAQEPVDVP